MAATIVSSSSTSEPGWDGYNPEQDLKEYDMPDIGDNASEEELDHAADLINQKEDDLKKKETILRKSRDETVAARAKLLEEKKAAIAQQRQLEEEQESLEVELEGLQTKDNEFKEAIEACEKKVAELQTLINDEEKKIQHANEVLAKMQSELEEIERTLREVAEEIKVCEEQTSKLVRDEDIATVVLADAESELKETQEAKAEADNELRTKLEEKRRSEEALFAANDNHITVSQQKYAANNFKLLADRDLEVKQARHQANVAAAAEAEERFKEAERALESEVGGDAMDMVMDTISGVVGLVGGTIGAVFGGLFGGFSKAREEEKKRRLEVAKMRLQSAEKARDAINQKVSASEAAVEQAELTATQRQSELDAATELLKGADLRLNTAKTYAASAATAHRNAEIAQRAAVAKVNRAAANRKVVAKSKAEIGVMLRDARRKQDAEEKKRMVADSKCRDYQIEIRSLQDRRDAFVVNQKAKRDESADLASQRHKLQMERVKHERQLTLVSGRLEYNNTRIRDLVNNDAVLNTQLKRHDELLAGLAVKATAIAGARVTVQERRAALQPAARPARA